MPLKSLMDAAGALREKAKKPGPPLADRARLLILAEAIETLTRLPVAEGGEDHVVTTAPSSVRHP